MGVSTLVRKAAKPLSMAGVAGVVAISLVVTTPSNAQAFVLPAPVLPAVFGATEMAIPELIPVASVLGPVGWGLAGVAAVTMLGVAAYETRDTWIPWVAGTFGQGSNQNKPAGTSAGAHILDGWAIQQTPTQTAGNLSFPTAYGGSQDLKNGLSTGYSYVIDCKRADGSIDTRASDAGSQVGNNGGPYSPNPNLGVPCNFSNETPVGAIVGAPGADPAINPACTDSQYPCGKPGPSNVIRWGTRITGSGPNFDPHDPKTRYTTTVECLANDGSKVSISRDWGGDSPGAVIPSCEAQGLGHNDGKTTITGTPPEGGQPTNLLDMPVITPNTTQPLCGPSMPGPGCKLQILIDGKPCTPGDWECVNWKRIDQSRVQCYWGPYLVDIKECDPLKRAYDPVGAPVTPPNIDPDPNVGSDTGLDGKPQPGPGTPPVAQPVPGTGGQPDPGASPEAKDCFPTGWAVLNPVEWVFKPTQCALKWAFVPDTATMTGLQQKVQLDIDHVGFGPLNTAVAGMFTPLGTGGSGCSGPPITFAMDGQSQTIHPFDACTAPMSIAAGICNALFTVVFTVGGGLAFLRAVSSAFGYNFSFGRSSAGADA